MNLKRRTSVIAITILLACSGLISGDDCSEIGNLRKFYSEKQFITLDFLQLTHSEIFETIDSLGGKLWAGREGRFRLVMPGQIMASNGILYWSYSEENQQVLVDSVARLGDWNPLTLMYDPEQVYGCVGQKTEGKVLEFDMMAKDSLTLPQQFVMHVSPKGYIPKKLIYFDDNDSRIEVFINGFARPAILPDSLFDFQPEPGVEVIEMP